MAVNVNFLRVDSSHTREPTRATRLGAFLVTVTVPLVGCATSGNQPGNGNPGQGPGVGGSGGTFGSGTSTAGGSTTIETGGGALGGGAGIANPMTMSDAGHGQRCTDAGCSCIAIASIGHEGVWGPCSTDTTTAFQNWLNTQSTATVDNYDTTKPTLTADFLKKYDVLVLQWMVENGMQNNDGAPWVFSSDEISALKDWVNGGGGIIALNGYQCPGNGCKIVDVTATNQLLSFTDIQFNADDNLDPQATGYPGNSAAYDYCWGTSVPLGAPSTDAGTIGGTGTWDQTTPIGAHVNSVGAYVMRSIASTSATVDCRDGTHSFAVHEQIGNGHVVAYGDEWITYSGEWLGTGKCFGDGGVFANPYDPCYGKSPVEIFQIPQLWYNAIEYAASSIQCFTISNPSIIPIPR